MGESGPTPEPKLLLVAKAPDGGWGWAVVFASFIIHVVADGVSTSFSVFFLALKSDLKVETAALATVQAILFALYYLMGPIAGALVNRYGNRAVAVTGSVIAGTGFALGYFAKELHSVVYLYLTIGILAGSGLGLMFVPSIVAVSNYFEKKRAFATGIAVCGSGLGTVLIAPLSGKMVDNEKIGWPLALVILGGMFVPAMIVSFFFRPLSLRPVPPSFFEEKEGEIHNIDSEGEEIGGPATPTSATDENFPQDQATPVQGQQIRRTSAVSGTSQQGSRSEESIGSKGSTKSKRRKSSLIAELKQRQRRKSSGAVLQRVDIFYRGNVDAIQSTPSDEKDEQGKETTKKRQSGQSEGQQQQELGDRRMSVKSKEDEIMEEEIHLVVLASEKKGCHDFVLALKAMTDHSILKDPLFLLFSMLNFVSFGAALVPLAFLVDLALDLEVDGTTAHLLLSVYGVATTLSRVASGFVADKPWVNKWYMFNGSHMLLGVGTGLVSHIGAFKPSTRLYLLGAFAVLLGSTIGVLASLNSVLLVDLFGIEKLTNAFGLVLVFNAVGTLAFPPIAGLLYEVPKSVKYQTAFWFAGGFLFVDGIAYFLVPWMKKRRKRQSIISSGPEDDDIGDVTDLEVASTTANSEFGSL